MDGNEWLAGRFEHHRPRLRVVAYRMLGSLAEADDAVQDTWIRFCRSGAEDVENLGGVGDQVAQLREVIAKATAELEEAAHEMFAASKAAVRRECATHPASSQMA
jgi:Sigma-70 region 2